MFDWYITESKDVPKTQL